MLSPTAPIYGNLANATGRALAGLQRSVGRALRSSDPAASAREDVDGGKFVYVSRLESKVREAQNMATGIQNAISFAQLQDGYLQFAIAKYERMSVLASQASDPLLSSKDREDLNEEFGNLRGELIGMSLETFNGQRLFRGKAYELIDKGSVVKWTDAKAEVDAKNDADPDNWHYLATITSDAEQAEIALHIGSVGINAWLGGNDTAVEGEWRWTEGPEGLEENGQGRQFWQGRSNGSSVNGGFQNWGSNEPNNAGNEDYLQISQASNPVGSWNDLPDSGGGGGYTVKGYVIETDQGKLNLPILDGLAELQNVDIPRYMDSTLLNLSSQEKAAEAVGDLRSTLDTLSTQRASVGASLVDLHLAGERLDRHVAAGQRAFSRMTDAEIAEDLVRVSSDRIAAQGSVALLAQAKGVTAGLIDALL